MAGKYTVKKIEDGPYKGQWGVYLGKSLKLVHVRKADATKEAKHRNSAKGR